MNSAWIYLMFFAGLPHNLDIRAVLNQWMEKARETERLEYFIEREDWFVNAEKDQKTGGYAFIERDPKDPLFGFLFYGECFGVDEQYLYDGQNEIRINKTARQYSLSSPGPGFIGSPGGQMVVRELLFPETVFKEVNMIAMTKETFIIEYKYDDEKDVTNRLTIVELSRTSYLPQKITKMYSVLGNRAMHKAVITGLKINSAAGRGVSDFRKTLCDFSQVEKPDQNPSISLLNSPGPMNKKPHRRLTENSEK